MRREGGGAENISLAVVLLGSPLRKRRGSGDSPGLQNRRLASCDVNGAFDSHTLPPNFSVTCTLLRITATLSALPRLHVGCINPQEPSLQSSRRQKLTSHKRSWLSRGSRAGEWPGSSCLVRRAEIGR